MHFLGRRAGPDVPILATRDAAEQKLPDRAADTYGAVPAEWSAADVERSLPAPGMRTSGEASSARWYQSPRLVAADALPTLRPWPRNRRSGDPRCGRALLAAAAGGSASGALSCGRARKRGAAIGFRPAADQGPWFAADKELHFTGSLAIASSLRVAGQSRGLRWRDRERRDLERGVRAAAIKPRAWDAARAGRT